MSHGSYENFLRDRSLQISMMEVIADILKSCEWDVYVSGGSIYLSPKGSPSEKIFGVELDLSRPEIWDVTVARLRVAIKELNEERRG